MESSEPRWANEKSMLCPVCQVTLQMTDRQGIEIDYCPQCRGVWLDRGELDKLIQQLAPLQQAPMQQAPAPASYPPPNDGRYVDPHHEPVDPYHDPRRRRSFFDDLFGDGHHGGRRRHH